MHDEQDKVCPRCYVCGAPIKNGDEMVEEQTDDPSAPSRPRHRSCDESSSDA